MADVEHRPSRASALSYQDPKAAFRRLEAAGPFYGDRAYRAADPEGHIWTFSQTVTVMTPEQWDQASGFKTRTRL